MRDPIAPRFELQGGILRITGELHAAAEFDLRDATARLLNSGEGPFVIDITEVMYRGSSYVRLIAMAMMQAKEKGVTLTVRATERTARILEMGGIEKLGRIDTVPDA